MRREDKNRGNLTLEEAAVYCNVSPSDLLEWRSSRDGPPHYGGPPGTYSSVDLDYWLESGLAKNAIRKLKEAREMAEGWKAFEARIGRIFGGMRRGAQTSRNGEGKSDLIGADGLELEHWSVECKLLGRPNYQQMLDAARQAEAAAGTTQEPIAIIKRKRDHDDNALVVYRLKTFREWRLGTTEEENEE